MTDGRPNRGSTKLTLEDYQKIRDFIYGATGIKFEDKKLHFVKKRLAVRIKECGAESAMDYLRQLKFSDPRGTELQAFINSLTTNETYFFREFNQLAIFAEHCLPQMAAHKKRLANRRLRIWSAGCSTGEEAYTLAIILNEMLDYPKDWLLEIVATDIDTRVLRSASKGVYDKRSVKDVPPEYLDRWFTATRHGQCRVHPQLKRMVSFRQLNMTKAQDMAKMRNIDFIFCRNVMIYFDNTMRQKVSHAFHDSLNPGGYIFLGHSESMSRITDRFVSKRLDGMITYQKEIP